MSYSLIFQLFFASIFLFGANQANAGGCSSAGCNGAICTSRLNGGRPLLLDLAIHHATLNDPINPSQDYLNSTAIADDLGLDRLQKGEINSAYAFAMERIRKWERYDPSGSTTVAKSIERILAEMPLFKTPDYFPMMKGDDFKGSADCGPQNSRAAVYFHKNLTIISIPSWNRLGLYSRAGLLIHEALRHIQITDARNGANNDLQRIVDKISLTDPKPGETLDQEPFFDLTLDSVEAGAVCQNLMKIYQDVVKIDHNLTTPWRNRLKKMCGKDPVITQSGYQGLITDLQSDMHCEALRSNLDFLHAVTGPLQDLMFFQTQLVSQASISSLNNLFGLPPDFEENLRTFGYYLRHKHDRLSFLKLRSSTIQKAELFKKAWQSELKEIGVETQKIQ